MAGNAYPKLLRMTRREDFDAAFAAQIVAKDGVLVCHGRPNGLGVPRLGIVVGRRVRTAPARNRIKRLLREAFRLNREKFAPGWDYLFIPRKIEKLTLAEVAGSATKLAGKVSAAGGEGEGASK
ncbi:MAG: ribonuclease P protein component [Candidatus Brocadiae bacterium]|nr:ribonuclease P protein component [Candidatus Brocadiia bacterium]